MPAELQPIVEDKDRIEVRPLFGGDMQVELPKRFQDVSVVRDVPSHQEIFADVETDQSIIIELLDKAEITDQESITFHFNTLAEDADAQDPVIFQVTSPLPDSFMPSFTGPTSYKSVLFGQQKISKFREAAKNTVNIYMCCLRLNNVTTDVLITFNDPIVLDPSSSSSAASQHQQNPALTQEVFSQAIKSLRVINWQLFG
eukprot:TRINITY_DN3190_c0_g1_i1.p1 TRINITY_DN3190_c0_g1~~TRINITY_DN3190_c0_g1_i1.p1  ORF type:complete len:200 (-),score=50.31 TRINITY_DN3190_c0_g1_i1:89-688(-)